MSKRNIFIWENFGPGHIDRCAAVADSISTIPLLAIELVGSSSTYEWAREETTAFKRITLFPNQNIDNVPSLRILSRCLGIALRYRKSNFFLCHYERPEILILAWILRLAGARVYVMNDSKFDDYPRKLHLEVVKWIFYSPYHGALSSGERSADYLRFLGVPKQSIEVTYNTLSLARLRSNASSYSQEMGVENHQSRHFTLVARLVPKKNIFRTLEAYAIYVGTDTSPRRLVIAGSGPLECELRAYAETLGIASLVDWLGFVQTKAVSNILTNTLALLLLSTEEQFGNVVIEAQAFGVPCIVSTNVGARDHLIRSGVNGFIVEPENPRGAAYFMRVLASQPVVWREMVIATQATCQMGDVSAFTAAVSRLIQPSVSTR
jgi:glycosyltransferase involved in cell wall biosynthesis